jgi:hypothetical protein
VASTPQWTESELRAAVEGYLSMLADEQAGKHYSKAEVRNALQQGPLNTRSAGSIEYRMQNISAVLQGMGRTWIDGFKPAANIGPVNEALIKKLILELEVANADPPPTTFGEVVPSPELLMGVKAVWGAISSYVLCFGERPGTDAQKYSLPGGAARRAVERPFVIAIGGGRNVRDNLGGRVVNLARVSTVYGTTEAFVGPDEAHRLQQWPVSVALHEVWKFVGTPHLVADLGFPDRTILVGVQDGIIRPEAIDDLWKALEEWPIEAQPLPPISNFYDSGSPRLVHSKLPLPPGGEKGEEGQRIYKLQRQIERDPKLRKEAKRLNLQRHGQHTCEACLFAHGDSVMFDVHHPTPLAVGVRTTLAEQLIVLCPTCHRRAHRKSKIDPYSLAELREWISQGRP